MRAVCAGMVPRSSPYSPSSSHLLLHAFPSFPSIPSLQSSFSLMAARGFCISACMLSLVTAVVFLVHGLGGVLSPPTVQSVGSVRAASALPLSCPACPALPPLPAPPVPSFGPCLPCECPCAQGPYILQVGCEPFNEGLGSKYQRIKTSLTLSAVTGFTFLSERACFTESHNGWDFADRFWTHRSEECDSCSLRQRARVPIDLKGAPTQTWSEPMFHHSVCPPITADLRERLMAGDRGALADNVVGRDALYDMYAALQRTDTTEHSRLVFAFPHRERSTEFLNSCSAPVVRARYELSFRRQRAAGIRTLPDMDADEFHIAVHFRWGDTRRADVEKPDNRASFPLSTFASVVSSMLALDAMKGRTRVHFFSEGEPGEFGAFSPAGALSVALRLGESSRGAHSDTLDDLDVMAHADVLVGGESSFFALASQFAHNATRVLVGRTLDSNGARNPKYQDHGTGFYAPMLTLRPWDLKAFTAQLEALPQYARKARAKRK